MRSAAQQEATRKLDAAARKAVALHDARRAAQKMQRELDGFFVEKFVAPAVITPTVSEWCISPSCPRAVVRDGLCARHLSMGKRIR